MPAAIAPVVVGAACTQLSASSTNNWYNAVLALIVSLALQVAVNFANDYSDGVRGTDSNRVGPMRLVGSGAKSPVVVKRATFIAFGVAAVLACCWLQRLLGGFYLSACCVFSRDGSIPVAKIRMAI